MRICSACLNIRDCAHRAGANAAAVQVRAGTLLKNQLMRSKLTVP